MNNKVTQLTQIFKNLKGQPNIEIVLNPHQTFMLTMFLQLALRSPNLNDEAISEMRELAQWLIDILGDIDPQAKEFLEQNWK